jgi:transposase-like protein
MWNGDSSKMTVTLIYKNKSLVSLEPNRSLKLLKKDPKAVLQIQTLNVQTKHPQKTTTTTTTKRKASKPNMRHVLIQKKSKYKTNSCSFAYSLQQNLRLQTQKLAGMFLKKSSFHLSPQGVKNVLSVKIH